MKQLPDLFRGMFSSGSDPFNELARMQKQMDQWFPTWGMPASGWTSSFRPSCDVEETADHYLMSFDLPGMKKEDIKIEYLDGVLSVSGERREETEKKEKRSYQSERVYGSFLRTFSLPVGIKPDQINTEYKDGVLRIAVPKPATSKSQQIPVGEFKPGFWDKFITHKKDELRPATQGEKRPAERVA